MTDATNARVPDHALHAHDAQRENRVLVAYSSKYGSTKGVAGRIAARLVKRGHRVELRPVDEVDGVDDYSAVVFGSAVFNQAWMVDAEEFVQRNKPGLYGRPLWIFSVGTFGDRKRLIGRLMTREPRGINGVLRDLQSRDYRVFAGVIDRHQWPLGSRLFYYALGGRLGDNRDWTDIESWAERIAQTLSDPCGENYGSGSVGSAVAAGSFVGLTDCGWAAMSEPRSETHDRRH
jgi:menaquinone-dependent protoporphyrinogen oxidase